MEKLSPRRTRLSLITVAIAVLLILYASSLLPGAEAVMSVLSPLLTGTGLAYVMSIFVGKLEKVILPKATQTVTRKLRRGLTILISFLIVAVLIMLIMYLIIPALKDTVIAFTNALPGLYDSLETVVLDNEKYIPSVAEYFKQNEFDAQGSITLLMGYLSGGVSGLLGSASVILTTTFSIFFDLVMAILFSLSLLYNKENLIRDSKRLMKAYIPQKKYPMAIRICTVANQTFSSFISGQLIQAVILTALCIGGMYLFGFPEPVMIGIFVGVMALIPLFGSYIGAIVGTLIVLAQQPDVAIWFAVFIICLEQTLGSVIYPKVVGKSIGLPSMWVFAAVLVGGGLFGVVGMLLVVPLCGTVYRLLKDNLELRQAASPEAAPETAPEAEDTPANAPVLSVSQEKKQVLPKAVQQEEAIQPSQNEEEAIWFVPSKKLAKKLQK